MAMTYPPSALNTSSPTDLVIDPLLTGNVTEGVDKRRRRQPKANTEQTDAAVSSGAETIREGQMFTVALLTHPVIRLT